MKGIQKLLYLTLAYGIEISAVLAVLASVVLAFGGGWWSAVPYLSSVALCAVSIWFKKRFIV